MEEDRNTTGIYGDHREAPYEMLRDARLHLLAKMALTDNTKNTTKEDLILETVENFRTQYAALYPTRAPLLLSPQNEYGCRKFISTFIRPSQLKFDELFDWYSLAKFVSNYVRFEELSELTTLPTAVTSPTTTMQWQIGNCIELAILLASLLIGDGYNAYVCIGYASKAVCANDLTETPWPDALPEEVNPDDVVTPTPVPASDYVGHLKERPKLISQFDEHERKHGGYKVLEDDDSTTNNNGAASSDAFGGGNNNNNNADGDNSKLVHAWVMVRPDRRSLARPETNLIARLNLQTTVPFLGVPSTTMFHESALPNAGGVGGRSNNKAASQKDGGVESKRIDEPIFIEPATGAFLRASDPAASAKYDGIEAIFNKENYFVNMNPDLPTHKLSMDLKDLAAWERIFLADPSLGTGADGDESSVGGGAGAGSGAPSRLGATVNKNGTVSLGGTVGSLGGTMGGGTMGLEPTYSVGEGGDQTLDLQLTWVAPITLTLAQYANRYPDRQKTIVYAGATVEMFAEYSEPDLKVLTVTIDDEARGIKEVHTFYKHRSDRMRRRSILPQSVEDPASPKPLLLLGDVNVNLFAKEGPRRHLGHGHGPAPMTAHINTIRTHYWFEPGRMQEGSHRVEGLRELIIEPGIQRIMRFYWKSRDDGLAMRIERFFNNNNSNHHGGGANNNHRGVGVGGGGGVGPSSSALQQQPVKVKEYYKGRGEDFLVYRSAKYDQPRDGAAGGGLGVAALAATASAKDSRHDPIKMSEKYARNPNTHIDADVQKRVYTKPQSNDGEIWAKYHYRPGCITRGIRLYPKTFDREKDLTAAAMIAKDQGRDTAAADAQPYVVLMPDMERPKDTDLLNELRVLADKENECLNEIRAKADDCRDILAHLNLDREAQQLGGAMAGYGAGGGAGAASRTDKDKNQRDTALISIFDTLRSRTKETEAEIAQRKAEEQRRAESRKDYLAPFIAKQENMAKICKGDYTNAKLSLEMARKVRDEAIADLKERLIERGHIMQSRLDKEREDLMRRQMAFQKAIDGSDGTKESEEFSRFGKEATWRIRILEERLSNYIKSSADKYRQLADRLANDKRLAALYTTGEQR